MKLRYLIPFLFALPMMAQVYVQPPIITVSTAPSGSCAASLPQQYVKTTGDTWSCQSVTAGVGTWTKLGGSGGGGNINGTVSATHLTIGTGADTVGDSPAVYTTNGGFAMNAAVYGTNLPLAVNVTQPPYNAVCDGHTDDHVAIQAALNSGASIVELPYSNLAMTYQCNLGTTTLTIPITVVYFNGNQSILGYAGTGAALDAATDFASTLFYVPIINDLFIDMTGSSGAAEGILMNKASLHDTEVYSGPANYIAVDASQDATHGFIDGGSYFDGEILVAAGGIRISDSYIGDGTQQYGVVLNNENEEVVISNSKISSTSVCAVCITGEGTGTLSIDLSVDGADTGVIVSNTGPYLWLVNGAITNVGSYAGTYVSGAILGFLTTTASPYSYVYGTVQMPGITGHGSKGPVCTDASGNLYVGNNTGVGAPCP